MPTPANYKCTMEFQDNRGFRANAVVNGFVPDITAGTTTLDAVFLESLATAGAVAALSNAKLIRAGFAFDYDYAQEPATESGVYELVQQKARLQGGDGNGGFMSLSVPAPKDAIFLTSADNNLIVVNPAAGLITTNLPIIAAGVGTARGGAPFAQFFGGQLVEGKPRRRRVLQGT